MIYTTCKNCGYEHGLHHYQTMQCPVGGEARIGHKQEWMTLTYLAPDERDETIAALKKALLEIDETLSGDFPVTRLVKEIAKNALKDSA